VVHEKYRKRRHASRQFYEPRRHVVLSLASTSSVQ
jgi:hypothetical protein